MITKINNKIAIGVVTFLLPLSSFLFLSCEDFFEQDSDYIIYADQEHLNSHVDTLYSMTGILNQLQLLADRTILLGEVRGDLVTITNDAPAAVRQIAEFNVDDDNIYNSPRDYYTVINNCNYFITHADTALRNNRDEYIFMREFAAVKAIRAWTYLQLALNYGEVRYVTQPILTKQDADNENAYPMLGIEALCDELIKDLTPLVPAYANEYPSYLEIGGVDTRFCYFPIYVMLGELNLWAGHYREAALAYYRYISSRNGTNSVYPTGTSATYWTRSHFLYNIWLSPNYALGYGETYSSDAELITMIPISKEYDSVPNPHFNQLRPLYNTVYASNERVSLVPSQSLKNISAAQNYFIKTKLNIEALKYDTLQAPKTMDAELVGDLRYNYWVVTTDNYLDSNNDRIYGQAIRKFSSRNVHIWRRQMVYLHMAEALNRAGYPRFAYKILQEGVNNRNIGTDVLAYYTTAADSAYINQFHFNPNSYILTSEENLMSGQRYTQQGLHSRGSGDAWVDTTYVFPTFTTGDTLSQQIDSIERMILTEGALEFAFEGLRYYDLVRMALRRNDPAFLADRVYGRRGSQNTATVKSEIKKDLYDKNNWFLNWNGKIGLSK